MNRLSRIILLIGLIIGIYLFVNANSYAAVNPDFAPHWNVGDSWDMVIRQTLEGAISTGVESSQTSVVPNTWVSTIHFNVIDHREIDSESCYVLELTYKNPNNQFEQQAVVQLYIRESDFTLKKILEITRDLGSSKQYIDNYHNNGHEFIIFRIPLKIPLPCDFPNFPATNTDEERTVQTSSDSYPETQKITFVDQNTLKVELSTPDRNGMLKIIQIWQKGKPWWSSVDRTLTYNDLTQPGNPPVTKMEYNNVLVGTDTTPPNLTLKVIPNVLWPSNHKMVKVTPIITVTDDYDQYPDITLDSITSNEPDKDKGKEGEDKDNGKDDKKYKDKDDKDKNGKDILVTPDGQIFLRAERNGKNGTGNSRIYTIIYYATDASGNKAVAAAIVTVPHDKRTWKR